MSGRKRNRNEAWPVWKQISYCWLPTVLTLVLMMWATYVFETALHERTYEFHQNTISITFQWQGDSCNYDLNWTVEEGGEARLKIESYNSRVMLDRTISNNESTRMDRCYAVMLVWYHGVREVQRK